MKTVTNYINTSSQIWKNIVSENDYSNSSLNEFSASPKLIQKTKLFKKEHENRKIKI
jgi:hypothetical protein